LLTTTEALLIAAGFSGIQTQPECQFYTSDSGKYNRLGAAPPEFCSVIGFLTSRAPPLMSEVEVFQTNVPNRRTAAALLRQLQQQFPTCRITFDLDDCDRILRVQSPAGPPDAPAVVAVLQASGYACSILPD
jgi:hypothetical protein